MSLKNLKWKRLTSELQNLKKSKKEFDEKYDSVLSVENFNNIINTIIIEESSKIVKKLAKKYKFSYDDAIKQIINIRVDETNIVNDQEQDSNTKEVSKPIFNKILLGKKHVFINDKSNDTNIYDNNMKVIGEIKITKEYILFT